MDIHEELEIEGTLLQEEQTTLIYMITGISYAALGLLFLKFAADWGLELLVGAMSITSIIGWLLVIGGLLVVVLQLPKLSKERSTRLKFEKEHFDADLEKELNK